MKFSFATIQVKDLDESVNFYSEVLGMSVANRFQAGPNEIAFMAGDGGAEIELICVKDRGPIEHSHELTLGLAVPDLDEAMKNMEAKGVPVHSGPFQPNPKTRFFFILDPNGAKLQLIEQK